MTTTYEAPAVRRRGTILDETLGASGLTVEGGMKPNNASNTVANGHIETSSSGSGEDAAGNTGSTSSE